MKVSNKFYECKNLLSAIEDTIKLDEPEAALFNIVRIIEALGELSAEIIIFRSQQAIHKGCE